MHVRETTSGQDKIGTSSNRSSIGAYISEVAKIIITSTQCVQDILAAYSMDYPIWFCTDSCKILIGTVNSEEAMTDTHVAGQEYYNKQDQHYSFCSSNTGFEQIKKMNRHQTSSKKIDSTNI